MNIFKKKLQEEDPIGPSFEPIELFQSLYHQEGYSYLRGIQEEVLKEWHAIRDQRDVLCKMNTGSGKTLVSLLMLYSKMIEGVGPGLYVCPDNQLLSQAKKQAFLYGIPVCEIEQPGNKFPNDFQNSKSILLCTFNKLFNSRSIFERDNLQLGSIVIDDSHVCLDISRNNTSIELPFGNKLCERIVNLFREDLKFQAPGTFNRLIDGDPYAKILKIPYWSWLDRNQELIELIGEFSEDEELLFKWGLIADDLKSYDCFLGPKGIQIAPSHVPYHNVRSFNEAKHRYILSATFQDQIDLIKDLGIDKESIKNALVPKDRKDVGQRLILAPQRFDTRIADEQIINLAKSYANDHGRNVAVLVPSYERAKRWGDIGATVITNDTIDEAIDKLKEDKGQFYVLVNRYDGVDLNGDMCRVLILDGYPAFSSYQQVYAEIRLESVKASLKAQIIEQGLGRAVRSGSDYCVVILMGQDLLQFVGNTNNLNYFTPVTKKQLELGLTLLDEEDSTNSMDVIKETARLCLNQDESWRNYHSNLLARLDPSSDMDRITSNLEVAALEAEALTKFRRREHQEASNHILQRIVDSEEFTLTEKHQAWYFEKAAQYLYPESVSKSNDLQIRSAALAPHMLQPKNGYKYTKINAGNGQAEQVLRFIKNFENPQDLLIYMENILGDLLFSPDVHHTKFENALAEVGRFIGYHAQEPELEFGNGPDVLWVMTDNHYLILEAKSRAIHNEISRDNIGQLLQSGEWFKKLYGEGAQHHLVTLQPPNIKGWNVNPSQNTRVIDETSLNSLKENVRHFLNGLISAGGSSASIKEISNLLHTHNLTPNEFRMTYLKPVLTKKK
ncbi:DEAD/DEAH box helicase [Ekhidna sp. To15]|uniref:DEAD/DEAH box helicase n=1 Tax=Ekhidna sp. To15 TaxID=3395267 RepID=UPI003F5275EA